jgi:endonuclease III
MVRYETQHRQTITRRTFERIINWKSPRAKGKINWRDYRIYQKAFQQVLSIDEDERLEVLVALPGIGAPIASVILHFIFPTVFPIYDFRTTETLHHFGYINSKT